MPSFGIEKLRLMSKKLHENEQARSLISEWREEIWILFKISTVLVCKLDNILNHFTIHKEHSLSIIQESMFF